MARSTVGAYLLRIVSFHSDVELPDGNHFTLLPDTFRKIPNPSQSVGFEHVFPKDLMAMTCGIDVLFPLLG